jgi:hypothetical protein
VGSLLFTGAFSLSVSMTQPKVAGLPFYIAAFFYSVSYCYTKRTLSTIATKELGRNDCLGNKEETLTLLESSEDLMHADSTLVCSTGGVNWSSYGAEGTASFATSDKVLDFPSSFPGIPI